MRALIGNRPLILVGAQVVLRDDDGEVLLAQRSDDAHWTLPGGGMEIGETLEATARREVREEVGIEIEDLTLFDVLSGPQCFHVYPNGDQVAGVAAIYVAQRARGCLRVDMQEVLQARFWSLRRLPTPMHPFTRHILERIRECDEQAAEIVGRGAWSPAPG